MPHYLVTKPCKYVSNGKPHYHRAGEIVELNDTVAAHLVRHIKATRLPKGSIKEKYGDIASYVDPLILPDREPKIRETPESGAAPFVPDTANLEKGNGK